ncbi:MAG: hypothetical protein RJA05_2050 [Planctomycetota bacterium]
MDSRPLHLDLVRDEALSITWDDGHSSRLPIALLRRMSPSADQRQLREEMASNPLTVLPSRTFDAPIRAESIELVGNYALRIRFSDGHDTGIYSWRYLRSLDAQGPTA